jgi:hypothetical protein
VDIINNSQINPNKVNFTQLKDKIKFHLLLKKIKKLTTVILLVFVLRCDIQRKQRRFNNGLAKEKEHRK